MDTQQNSAHQVSALNDLIRINNDRITGYKKRMIITLDDDLDFLFSQFIYQSRQNVEELTEYIRLLDGSPAGDDCLSGKFYHSWTDFRSLSYQQDRQTILDYCEYGEDVAKSAYKKAMEDKEFDWNKKIANVLLRHLDDLRSCHKLIKGLCDGTANAA
ncbi:MAG TPA: PA2169 family four-helix-bundle protein [Mucilaginibacter sp.]